MTSVREYRTALRMSCRLVEQVDILNSCPSTTMVHSVHITILSNTRMWYRTSLRVILSSLSGTRSLQFLRIRTGSIRVLLYLAPLYYSFGGGFAARLYFSPFLCSIH